MIRQGLRTVLDAYTDVDIIGEAANGEEAVILAERLHPHVVVMDVNMPRMNGVEATRQIKRQFPDIIVIGLSVNAEGETIKAMEKAGASLLLTKEVAVEQLYSAIHQAVAG